MYINAKNGHYFLCHCINQHRQTPDITTPPSLFFPLFCQALAFFLRLGPPPPRPLSLDANYTICPPSSPGMENVCLLSLNLHTLVETALRSCPSNSLAACLVQLRSLQTALRGPSQIHQLQLNTAAGKTSLHVRLHTPMCRSRERKRGIIYSVSTSLCLWFMEITVHGMKPRPSAARHWTHFVLDALEAEMYLV